MSVSASPAFRPAALRRSGLLAALVLLLLPLACSDDAGSGPEEVVETRVVAFPPQISFDALGDTLQLIGRVEEEDGTVVPDAVVTWTSSDPSVVEVDPEGRAVSAGNGSAVVTASHGGSQATIQATVDQFVSRVVILSGDGQAGVVGQPLPAPLSLRLEDRLGSGVPGVDVAFDESEEAGTVQAPDFTTDAQGQLEATWTLGGKAGRGITMRAFRGNATLATFEADVEPGAPAALDVVDGGDQVGIPGQRLGEPIRFRVTDSFGNPVEDVVQVTATSGSGQVEPPSQTSDARGEAAFVWTLGPEVGVQSLEATAQAAAATASVDATVVTAAGPPEQLVWVEGDADLVPAESTLPVVAVQVQDAQGVGVAGVEVAFSVSDGELDATRVVSDNSGRAVTAWTLGPTVGSQRIEAAVDGLAPVALDLATTAPLPSCAPDPLDPAGFDIELCFLGAVSEPVRAAFLNAQRRWEEIIVDDVPEVSVGFLGSECIEGGLPVQGVLDDLVIWVSVQPIDGPFSVLGSAGPCFARSGSLIPFAGLMRFDEIDLDRLLTDGQLEDVILHEMGHVLGIGTLWADGLLGLLENPSDGSAPLPDTHFTGPAAIAAFDAAGGAERTSGAKVPVENQGGRGTRNGHWRESTMNVELMTGFLDSGVANPLSAITIASMQDMGYGVNPAVAEDYTVSNPNGAPAVEPGREPIAFGDDIARVPLRIADETGRVLRVVPPPPEPR
jgi:hypothetical protein